MVVTIDKRLQEILALYAVSLNMSENSNDKDTFVDVVDGRNKRLQMTVQYSDNQIYCVYFLNNQYFEESVETLYEIVSTILMGNYRVLHRGIFKKSRYVEVNGISPERITSDDGFESVYDLLPIGFDKKI